MNIQYNFLVRPVAATATSQTNRKRQPRSGPMVSDPRTIEIRNIKKTQATMTTKEFAAALSSFDGIRTGPETMQAYMQGYISSETMIEAMLERCRALVAHQKPNAKLFSDMSMVDIIEGWFTLAQIDRAGAECKWRKLAKMLNKDHSTLFRWYKQNRKPRSLDTLLGLDEALKKAIANSII